MGEELFLWSPCPGAWAPLTAAGTPPLLCCCTDELLSPTVRTSDPRERVWFIVSIINEWNVLAWPHAVMGQEPPSGRTL